jgi:broad specificity phosphatase PhoE
MSSKKSKKSGVAEVTPTCAGKDLIRRTAAGELKFGYWDHSKDDFDAVLLDDHLATIPSFHQAFDTQLRVQMKLLYNSTRGEGKAILAEFQRAFELIRLQIEWAMQIRETSKLQSYLELANLLLPYLTRALKQKDKSMSKPESLRWLARRRDFGLEVTSFLSELLSQPHENSEERFWSELTVLQAITAVDNIALPQLESAEAHSKEVDAAETVLLDALQTLHSVSGYAVESADVNYWRSKCYRHLAMVAIKQIAPRRALFRLANSGFFIRHVRGDEGRKELSQELLRGYAEVHSLMGNKTVAKEFLRETTYRIQDIGRYIPHDALGEVEYDDVAARLKLLLIRHQERETDEQRQFGFNGKITARGQREFRYLGDTASKIVGENFHEVVITASQYLEEEASEFAKRIRNSRTDSAPEVRVKVSDQWNSIDVGRFRGLTEPEAKLLDPGRYSVLERYRLRVEDGFSLEFPGGENVREFEERIAVRFAELLDDICADRTEEDLATNLPTRLVVVYGHTSTITALLNLCCDFRQKHLHKSIYGFHPIQTGTVVEGLLDLKARSWAAQEHRLSY